MAANTKRNLEITSFGNVFVDNSSTSISIHEMSTFNCFHYVLFSGFCGV